MKITIFIFLILIIGLAGFYAAYATAQGVSSPSASYPRSEGSHADPGNEIITGMNGNSSTSTQVPISSTSSSAESRKVTGVNSN